MKNKRIFPISFIVMVIALICMGIHTFIQPFPDFATRLTGIILLIDIFILTYSRVKYKNS